MKKIILLLGMLYAAMQGSTQSVGIGTNNPDASAQLDISNTSKGLLIPRMATSAINSINNPAKGLLVYDSVQNKLMVNMGSASAPNWQPIAGGSGWSLTGNSGTNPPLSFLGTKDGSPLYFKVNNNVAGYIDTGGSYTSNTAFGYNAQSQPANGTNNTGIGFNALENNFGSWNTAIGSSALTANQSGNDNTAIGNAALAGNQIGNDNSAFGYKALYANVSGGQNCSFGSYSLVQNSSGNYNAAFGYNSLAINTTGSYNTGIGYYSLQNNSTGSYNTALGTQTLVGNTTGTDNTAIGSAALYYNTTGSGNIAAGYNALLNNTTGSKNSAFGNGGLLNNTTGVQNTAIGYAALVNNTTANNNTATGYNSLWASSTGTENTAYGVQTLFSNTVGNDNTALGTYAMQGNTSGSYNTAVGEYALIRTTASQYNTCVGYNSGQTYDNGYNNVFLGANCDVNGAGYYNVIAIGQGVVCTAPSQARIGNSATNSIGGYADWTNFSDGRFKKDIQENVSGLNFIMKLRPVTYHLDVTGLNRQLLSGIKNSNPLSSESVTEKEQTLQTGFVAQEVEKAAQDAGFDFSGVDKPKNPNDFYGLRYSQFVVPLVKAVQEQQQMIVALKQKVDALEEQDRQLQQALNSKK